MKSKSYFHMLQTLRAQQKKIKEILDYNERVIDAIEIRKKTDVEYKKGRCSKCGVRDLRFRKDGGYFCRKCGYDYYPDKIEFPKTIKI